MTTDLNDFARDRDAETASSDFMRDSIPFASDWSTDEALLDFVQSRIEFAQECEEAHYDGHAEDALDPIHGTDLDPCAICQPTTEFDMIVANLHDQTSRLVVDLGTRAA